MTDYKFINGQGYRFTLTTPTVTGAITANPAFEVSVTNDNTPYSHWYAEIDSSGNVSLLNDGLQAENGQSHYLEQTAKYLDAKATGPVPKTHVKFNGTPQDGYTFTITDGGNAVKDVTDKEVVRLHTVVTSNDKFFIQESDTKQ